MSITYRTTGSTQWTGQGSDLASSQVDANFFELRSTISDIAAAVTPIEGLTSTSFMVSSGVLSVYGEDGTYFGGGNLPTGNELITSTASAPSSAAGQTGDAYLYHGGGGSTFANLYGPKVATGWPSTYVSLVGPQGAAGPTGSSGTNGSSGANGAPGAAGSSGANGLSIYNSTVAPSSGNGITGDSYIHTFSGSTYARLYGPKVATGWPSTYFDLRGADGSSGANGTNGSSGANGLSIYNSTAAPSSGNGITGDSYIHTFSGSTYARLYGPKVATGWPSTYVDLRGADGSPYTIRITTFTPSSGLVTVDWSATDIARVPLNAATVTMTFSGAVDGQKCTLEMTQSTSGGNVPALPATVRYGSDITSMPTASTAASKIDRFGFIYASASSKYDFVAYQRGF
jgi:hypothetical protein